MSKAQNLKRDQSEVYLNSPWDFVGNPFRSSILSTVHIALPSN